MRMPLPRVRRIPPGIGSALVGLMVAACGAESDSAGVSSFSRSDSGGVELAVTTFEQPAAETGWMIDPASEIEYGGAGAGEVNFTWIRDATQLPDGRVVALDPRAPELFVFAPTGELLVRMGREGDGPGEFRRPGGVEHLGGDTLLVYDSGHMRFSLFGADGDFLDDRSLERPGTGEDAPRLTLYELVDAAGDTLILRGAGFAFRSSDSGDYVWENPTLRYGSDGSLVGEVAEPTKLWFYGTPEGPRTMLFGGSQQIAGGAERVYVSDRGRCEVRVYEPPAGLVRINRLKRPRRPVTDDAIAAYEKRMEENIGDADRIARWRESMEHRPVADSMPCIQDLLADETGNVWFREVGRPGRDSVALGVFGPEGEWLGSVDLPPNFHPLEIGAGYVLGVRFDELDVPHLVRYALERHATRKETAGQ